MSPWPVDRWQDGGARQAVYATALGKHIISISR